MKLSDIKVDPAVIEQGDWVDDLPNMPGVRIKARGVSNSDYRKLEAKLVRQIPKALRAEGLSPAQSDRILGRCLLETVVLDVDGLTEDDEVTPIKYTRELGEKLLLDPEWKEFRAAAAHAGSVVDSRRKSEIADDAKN
ncbi:hypothetical protein [Bradyrhizobium sp. SZCCHNR1020]|uniref:hypothetical protein n=1 Tax=Bradyrhizobium sp. SZCCHNR1020 TaxID=3057343 RepID=UPI0029163FF1|nr:hypothetical protein [Bradyrhizobium sp. SZCCHNR1020]